MATAAFPFRYAFPLPLPFCLLFSPHLCPPLSSRLTSSRLAYSIRFDHTTRPHNAPKLCGTQQPTHASSLLSAGLSRARCCCCISWGKFVCKMFESLFWLFCKIATFYRCHRQHNYAHSKNSRPPTPLPSSSLLSASLSRFRFDTHCLSLCISGYIAHVRLHLRAMQITKIRNKRCKSNSASRLNN